MPKCPSFQCRLEGDPHLGGLCDPCFGLLRIKPLSDEIERCRQIEQTARANRDRLLAQLRDARALAPRLSLNGKSLDTKSAIKCAYCRNRFSDAFTFSAHVEACELSELSGARPETEAKKPRPRPAQAKAQAKPATKRPHTGLEAREEA